MRALSNLQWPSSPFVRSDRLFGSTQRMIASLDVEWTKNYRIKGGSLPFCYSISMVHVPEGRPSVTDFPASFGFKSVYIDDDSERDAMLEELNADLKLLFESGSILVGHQLSSDLSVVEAAARIELPSVQLARDRWRERRNDEEPSVFDTRYDIDHLSLQKSRRLVDVCYDLGLEVTQPELRRDSMSKLHRKYIEGRDISIMERLVALNIRHSLSTAVVAAIGLGYVDPGPRNINVLLHQEMWDLSEYVRSDTFSDLLS